MRGRDGPPPRGQIQLGDLARALGLLNWRDDGEARAIAACLGFGLEAVAPVRPAKRIYDRQTEAAPEPAPGPAAAKPQGLRLPPAPEVPLPLPRHTLAAKLIPIDSLQPAEAVAATTGAANAATAVLAGDPRTGLPSAYVVNEYAQTAKYRVEYPEDIQVFVFYMSGLSNYTGHVIVDGKSISFHGKEHVSVEERKIWVDPRNRLITGWRSKTLTTRGTFITSWTSSSIPV